MIEWLKNLELEFIIIFGLLAIIVLVVIVLLIKAQRTLNLIGKRALVLTEDIVIREGIDLIDLMVANTSYVNVEAAAIGLVYKKKLLPLKEENTIVLARDSFKLTLTLTELRSYVLGDEKKVKKIKLYVEDSLGRRSFHKAKNSVRKLKVILKAERKAERFEDKKIRFETGQYRFFERFGLIIKFIFSPLTKLCKTIKQGLNRRLKRREEKLILKKIEQEHQKEMREISEEERREEERSSLEKRLFEEKQKANIDARKAALDRKERARKELEELAKAEEELKIAEAEAALHESETNLRKAQVEAQKSEVKEHEPHDETELEIKKESSQNDESENEMHEEELEKEVE